MSLNLRYWEPKKGKNKLVRLYLKGKYSVNAYVEEGRPFKIIIEDKTAARYPDFKNMNQTTIENSEKKIEQIHEFVLIAIENYIKHAAKWGKKLETFPQLAAYVKSLEEEEKIKKDGRKNLVKKHEKVMVSTPTSEEIENHLKKYS